MKNLSLILNAVLLIAVAVLFYLHFSSKAPSTSATGVTTEAGDLTIAYVNSDSVVKNYDYLKATNKAFEDKAAKMDQDYTNRVNSLRNEAAAYQRNVNSMTLGQVKATEEDLQRKQQNLAMYEQTLRQQLAEEQAKINKELYDRVTNYLKKYGKEKGLKVVLKRDPTSDVLFADEALDISKIVIDALNAEYAAEKTGAPAVKADSTAKAK
ncbi:OmpH family outer membrane protein [Pseudochryseolinea flava]|uniref:OmpH family outer membrane protein n=1 Tax=Pseudochryseolinea flava TaxID=2059302 RepID=A0A364Y2X2_9BACT|nr:OmpH family outer membrane protein [Pseudochryseolinea flava]RAW01235.1 OmpH family outer membrane protein [Pseudochryseolinea flava]